ncbi:sensor histidine kinase KdpD [Micromonospora sp. AMSO31t]|uniref:sensor histidine kinase n=1 Tax=Micromonospora sp. AMSO31t TaxID=2650566 RepID=UPI00124B2C4A|nr:HAMP domain-containing sensor histidine kinase [Micromonospora sp. AMSO31t]KAB1912856.1 HAMP domain-containing histidine kinase [Micromonospora sp. AMSO31t]
MRASHRVATRAPAPLRRQPAERDERLLVRVLCHELRTPVQALTALTRALAEDRRPLTAAERRSIAELAHEHAAHLRSLLDDLGDPPDRGRAGEERVVPLARVIRAVAAGAPHRRMRTRVSGTAARLAVPDRSLRQILTNLVDNAVRHGPAGGEVLVLATTCPGALTVSVLDRGAPDSALLATLARPTPSPGGSGLGLWIVRRLVDSLGGSLRARRPRTGGLAVDVRLPVPLRVGPAGPANGPGGPPGRERAEDGTRGPEEM